MRKKSGTVDYNEVEKFDKLADQWWDENGQYAILHTINPLRIRYIKDKIIEHFGSKGLKGLKLLDVGCGGGLVSAPIAILGASVTGIDASAANIKAAGAHARTEGLDIDFKNIYSETLAKQGRKYDVILALEIIEHVADVNLFIASLAGMLKPGGLIFISTINRTIKAKLTAKILAEYVLRWVPIGTHDFDKFVTPDELTRLLKDHKLTPCDFSGIVFKPLSNTWSLDDHNLNINYISCFKWQ